MKIIIGKLDISGDQSKIIIFIFSYFKKTPNILIYPLEEDFEK